MSDERLNVKDAIQSMFWAIDEREWFKAQQGLAKSLTVDYSAVNGREPAEVTSEEQVAVWQPLIEGFDATQHLLSAIRVQINSDGAVAWAQFQATHVRGHEHWTLGGSYKFELRYLEGAWRVTVLTARKLWETGNPDLATG